ncbi:ABC transporter ATP-binding protein [Neolewinella lacunae]|uniref:ABC transporter ATP-binding protein n=1 Tax=Neolewinella lacunae TaxID=1517758 RepID=A0A923PLT4_9BACT|nr:ABC transporter ATP-binding protein [Neolewinella lacunae]MBC6994036.1 ABC transporter ATP-binding protein [Neolewinella lacunae]MDN3634706.1 ABC transporter ATP-binding protein [Neolewinella lacunae]
MTKTIDLTTKRVNSKLALNLVGVGFRRNDRWILRDVSFSVAPGERVALLGPNGAGKSTLTDLITGMIRPMEGEVSVFGDAFAAHKGRIGVVFEYTPLFDYLTPQEVSRYHALMHGLSFAQLQPIIDKLGMEPLMRKQSYVLSNGERRKVGLLLALMHSPEFLILDEATANLDPFIRDQCWDLFQRPGRTILFSTHHWEEAERFADRIVFIHQGKVYPADTPSGFLSTRYLVADKKVVLDRSALHLPAVVQSPHFFEDDKVYVFPADLNAFLDAVKLATPRLSIFPKDLKDVFLYLTQNK